VHGSCHDAASHHQESNQFSHYGRCQFTVGKAA
jgi:hypothetical protein